MIIYPALDLRNGNCIRLYQGDYSQQTTYSSNPMDIVSKFVSDGAEWLHIVDLDGAKDPRHHQSLLISKLIKESGIQVQTGGGIRNKEQADYLLKQGAQRIIIGSLAVENPQEIIEWFHDFGSERLVLALDIMVNQHQQPMVATHAWNTISNYSLFDIIERYINVGLKHVLCTNISLDGTLNGPDYLLYETLLRQFPTLSLQASGGIQSMSDIQQLRKNGLTGAIIGRALYENKFTLAEVLVC